MYGLYFLHSVAQSIRQSLIVICFVCYVFGISSLYWTLKRYIQMKEHLIPLPLLFTWIQCSILAKNSIHTLIWFHMNLKTHTGFLTRIIEHLLAPYKSPIKLNVVEFYESGRVCHRCFHVVRALRTLVFLWFYLRILCPLNSLTAIFTYFYYACFFPFISKREKNAAGMYVCTYIKNL